MEVKNLNEKNEYKNMKLLLMLLTLIFALIGTIFIIDSPINPTGFFFTLMGIFAGYYIGFIDREQRITQES